MSSLVATPVLTGRALRLSRRNLDALITALALPVMLMLMFVYLFGGAISSGGDYVTYVVPGVILLCAGFGASQTAVAVTNDLTGGMVDRLRSMDVGGAAFLAGHVFASLLRNLVSTLVVFGVALAIGFRPHGSLPGIAAAIGILALFVVAVSWLSAVVGLIAHSPEGAAGFTFIIMFIPYPSSAFVPIDTMPGWLRGFAGHQPVTPVIESLRALLLGTPVGGHAWTALAWSAGILALSIAASNHLFARRTA